MPAHLKPTLAAGLLAAGLFLLIAASGLGVFFLFLPTLPLLIVGLDRAPKAALAGGLIAAVIIALAGGAGAGVLFAAGLGLPAWMIARLAGRRLRLRVAGSADTIDIWFPIGAIFTRLTLYACAGISLIGLLYLGEPGGFEAATNAHIHRLFGDVQGELLEAVELLAGPWSFLLFSMMIWLWGLVLYAHLWMAARWLAGRQRLPRGDVAIRPFAMPDWMFSLLAICALASLLGGPTTCYLGKIALVALMLPYFLLGTSLMHAASRRWPSRRIFLFFIYFFILSQFWPAFILSGLGLASHIKRLSIRGRSSKS